MDKLHQARRQAAERLTELLELRLCDDHIIGDTRPALTAVDAIANYATHAITKTLKQYITALKDRN